MKIIIGLFALLLIIVGGIALSQNYFKDGVLPFSKTPTATIKDHKFNLLVAKTPKEKEVGLSEKKSLDQNSGMLFPFEKEDHYSFWMKNMKFPIDIIYINKNKIVTIYSDVKPPESENQALPIYKPQEPASMVLEINAGLSNKYEFKKGDSVKIENF